MIDIFATIITKEELKKKILHSEKSKVKRDEQKKRKLDEMMEVSVVEIKNLSRKEKNDISFVIPCKV